VQRSEPLTLPFVSRVLKSNYSHPCDGWWRNWEQELVNSMILFDYSRTMVADVVIDWKMEGKTLVDSMVDNEMAEEGEEKEEEEELIVQN
jgi:hypothetical protein